MALTWKRRARRLKERKQEKLLVVQRKAEGEVTQAERVVERLQVQVKEHRTVAVEARKREGTAKAYVDSAHKNGIAPVARHEVMLAEATRTAEAANRKESAVLQQIREVKASIPEVPEVPTVEEVVLSKTEILSILLFVLLDVLHLNKWVALAIVGVGAAALFLADKQGWLDTGRDFFSSWF